MLKNKNIRKKKAVALTPAHSMLAQLRAMSGCVIKRNHSGAHPYKKTKLDQKEQR